VARTLGRFPLCKQRLYFSILTSVFLDITKYLGLELSTPVDIKTNLGQYAIKGAHNQAKLQDLLDGFIEKFVLCPRCILPETKLVGQNFNN
jgi:translation initiation factor 2 beta subunit (eIF-2beta)/eIF-5